MRRNSLLALVALIGCASRPHTAPNMPPQPERVAIVSTATTEPVEAAAERPHHPCVPVTDCRVVARHTLDSPFARAQGFYASPAGMLASRHADWQVPEARAEEVRFIEVSESCWVEGDFYIASEAQIWLRTDDAFDPIEVAHNARSFTPLGHSFFDDGAHIFERWEILDDEDVDRATFHACSAEPDDPNSATFYPCAEDSVGLFGYGEHGDVGRFRP